MRGRVTAQLTLAHLRGIDPGTLARGDAYYRDGRVVSHHVVADTVHGAVQGGARYQVALRQLGGRLHSACTCAVGASLCKHAVALALYHLGPAAGEPPPPADAFATDDDVAAFAAAHRATHALAISGEALLDRLDGLAAERHWLRPMLARRTIGEVGSFAAGRYHGSLAARRGIARAAHQLLHEEAAAIAAGLAEAGARPPEPPRGDAGPAGAAVTALWRRLRALHAELSATAAPRGRAARAGALHIDVTTCEIAWDEPRRVHRDAWAGVAAVPVAVQARLALPGADRLRASCTCAAPGAAPPGEVVPGGCTHVLGLIDATLDALAGLRGAEPAAAAGALAEELVRPPWERALLALDRSLDRLAAHPGDGAPALELWWQLDDDLGGFSPTPIVKKQLRRGGTSKGARTTPQRLLEEHGAALADRDRRVAEELAAWHALTAAAGGGPRGRGAGGTYPARALLALVDHPRVTAAAAERAGIARVEVQRAPLGFRALEAGAEIRLEPTVGGERLSPRLLESLLATFAPGEPLVYLELEHGRCWLIEASAEARELWAVLSRHGEAFPAASAPALLARLARLEARVPVAVPPALKGAEVVASPVTVARLRLLPEAALELELFVRPAPGAPLWHPGEGPREVIIAAAPGPGGAAPAGRGYVRRALADEPARARAHLAQLPVGDAAEGPPWCFAIRDPEAALALVAAADPPPPDLELQWIDPPPRVERAGPPEALRVQIERRRDWFGITGDLRTETGRLELAVVLDAARRQQRFVRVGERRWIELSEALQRHLRALADRTFATRGRLELSPGAAPAVAELASAGGEIASDAAWDELAGRLAAATALAPRPPAGLAGTLRDYQVAGHAWLARIAAWSAGACLADDMGLGKTVQAIALLLDRARRGPALVLAPTSVTFNWIDELRRFAPRLRPVLLTEQSERAAALDKLRPRDVLVASYGLLVRHAQALAARPFATLILDEAQALKNPATQRARAARGLDASFRLALTGTPLENHLGELWSLYSIVSPGLLGSWEQFRERFATPIERARDPDARAALGRVLRPFLLRRTKAEVARDLPPRIEIQLPIALAPAEQALYEDARLAAVAALTARGARALGEGEQRFAILAALTRLRLLACHPRLHDPTSSVPSSKLARVLELAGELVSEGHRALVFSQFTSHLALVREALTAAGLRILYLDGSTPAGERAARVRAFQAGEAELFLISLKAGGTGLNLTAADYVIHLDPWWNPAVEDQASDRAHRIGQTRPVTIYRLVARGTIEEQILALHADKRALVAGVLDGADAAARLSARDLLDLLRGGSPAGPRSGGGRPR
jgi:hypothetical protein